MIHRLSLETRLAGSCIYGSLDSNHALWRGLKDRIIMEMNRRPLCDTIVDPGFMA